MKSFVIPSKINSFYYYSGIDNFDHCVDKQHFKQYPHEIIYQYNSRGFRDEEWPTDLHNAAWCIGDSYTAGIGVPYSHMWPQVLSQKTGKRTINVSMDGASNNWIARKAGQILDVIQPKLLILHWSFVTRREEELDVVKEKFWQRFYNDVKDTSWPCCPSFNNFDLLPIEIQQELTAMPCQGWKDVADDNRLIYFLPDATDEQDIDNTINCLHYVNQHSGSTKIIHSFIPECINPKKLDLFADKLKVVPNTIIPFFSKLDFGRDGIHYDIKTAEFFVDALSKHLK